MTRLLSWLEYRIWLEKIAVTICTWCDCSLLTTPEELDTEPHGPIMTPAKWPPELAQHE